MLAKHVRKSKIWHICCTSLQFVKLWQDNAIRGGGVKQLVNYTTSQIPAQIKYIHFLTNNLTWPNRSHVCSHTHTPWRCWLLRSLLYCSSINWAPNQLCIWALKNEWFSIPEADTPPEENNLISISPPHSHSHSQLHRRHTRSLSFKSFFIVIAAIHQAASLTCNFKIFKV